MLKSELGKKSIFRNKYFVFVSLCITVLLYLLPFLLTGSKIAPGDADFQFQAAEAFRRSVLEFHQFPWWNPWVAGGVPLYANAQFGVFSIQSIFILIFGSVFGLKLSIALYYLIGFFGFRRLFAKYFSAPTLRATLLAYIWIFGTFLAYRVAGGHFTFLYIQFFPWLFYLYSTRHDHKRNWIYFALLLSVMVLGAPHYMTILSFLVLALLFFIEIVRVKLTKNTIDIGVSIVRKDLVLFTKVFLVFLIICGHRLFYTLAFIADYPRPQTVYKEPFFGLFEGIHAIALPFNQVTNAPILKVWTWQEASAYIGFMTFAALVLVILGSYLAKKYKEAKSLSDSFNYQPYLLLFLFALFFLLALGEFSKLSPYFVFRRLPFLDSLRVAPRWFVWASMICLFLIATYKGKRFNKAINILLLASVIELFFLTKPLVGEPYKHDIQTIRSPQSAFEQQAGWTTGSARATYDRNLLEATANNYGQVIADDPLIDTRSRNTIRCDVDNEGCSFVQSNNAKVIFWSPNKIVLERTSTGDIELNMNPGAGWQINDKYPFAHMKVTEVDKQFIVQDPALRIHIQYKPRFSVGWLKNNIFEQ